jgi:hypothetical protein
MSERACAASPGKNGITRRERWMRYPVHAAAAFVLFDAVIFLVSLNATREFIGSGSEYCWMFGSFQRYVTTSLVLICVNVIVLLSLYWLARRNHLFVYLIVWVVWLFGEPLLSYFDRGYC